MTTYLTREITQAERLISKFGGPVTLAKILGKDPATLYRWMYSKERGGTGGLVPSSAVPAVMEAARMYGIFLTAEDWAP